MHVAHPLVVSAKLLDPEEELRNVFGMSIASIDGRERRAPQRRGPRGGVPRNMGQRRIKRAVLLCKAGDLPQYDGSLIMDCVSTSQDGSERSKFRYTGTGNYKTASMLFEQARNMMDPNQIVAVLRHYPFHVESLLAMNDFYAATNQVCTTV
jgi:hypothetical protein